MLHWCRNASIMARVPRVPPPRGDTTPRGPIQLQDRKSTRLNSSHLVISYAVFCLKKKKHALSHPLNYPQLNILQAPPPCLYRVLIPHPVELNIYCRDVLGSIARDTFSFGRLPNPD